MTMDVLKTRLIVNAVGCVALLLVCLPTGLWLAASLAYLPAPRLDDPDAGKALGLYLTGIAMTGLLSASALFSLRRSLRALRPLRATPRSTT